MFTRKFTIPEYGWEAELYEPTTGEEQQLIETYDKKDQKFPEVIAPLIKSWNFTDRQGNPLSITPEGVSKVPRPVLFSLVKALLKSGYEGTDSKNTSAS